MQWPKMNRKSCVNLIRGAKPYVVKSYFDNISYENETEAYQRLNGSPYIAEIYEIGDNFIKMEYLDTSLKDYVKMTGHLPYDLAKQAYTAFADMLDRGVYDFSDQSKYEHYYVKDDALKIIDFDVSDVISDKQYAETLKDSVKRKFLFLFQADEKSESEFKNSLIYYGGFDEAICDDFFKHMERF